MGAFDVTIAGELNLDLILYGLPKDLPIERELLASGFEMTLGSSSAILAHNMASLGVSVGLAGLVGDDEFGRIALGYLSQVGVDLSQIVKKRSHLRTGVTVLLPHEGVRRILTYAGAASSLTVNDLDIDYLSSGRHFHLSSLFLQVGLHAELPKLFRELKARGLTISLDTNDDPSGRWDGVLHALLPMVDILLPNRDELCRIARRTSVDEALDELSAVVPLIVVKCGPEGSVVQQGERRAHIPAALVQAVDSIGAGDSFNAGFLASWLAGVSAEESARAGNIAGALSTMQAGGVEAFRRPPERDAFLQKHGFPSVRQEHAVRQRKHK